MTFLNIGGGVGISVEVGFGVRAKVGFRNGVDLEGRLAVG